MAEERGFSFIFVPEENGGEAAVLKRIRVVPIRDLTEAIDVLEERNAPRAIAAVTPAARDEEGSVPDFSEIKGQEHAKRALMIAAAGAHNLLMIGPPGVGKSLLSQALVGILPDLDLAESIEITKIYSAAGLHPKGLVRRRPFRSPHQTASLVSIVGGGTNPKPGEISLSHRGVLFLDELPEFPRNVLEALRQPMESGSVHVARAKGTLAFPAKFGLIAAMNPCPCGFYGDAERECRCTPYEVLKYEKRISGPLLDRIDLQIKVPRVALATLRETSAQKESPLIKAQVEAARAAQRTRLKGLRIATNAEMGTKQVERFLSLAPDAERFLIALDRAKLSPRGYYRLLKVARTIADIDVQRDVTAAHLAEAFSYRLREET
jgi:magnesium chelatase family protein